MEVEVVKFDNFGRGIGYINNKIIFISKTVPGDIVTVKITKEKKDYLEGSLLEIIKPSKIRKAVNCPYFSFCGGCDLLQISLSEMLEYKLNKVNDIFKRNNILFEIKEIIKSNEQFNYRNKITLKVVNGLIGFYENNTHKLIEISNCLISENSINNIIKDLNKFNIKNGEIVIRTNYKDELIVWINSKDKLDNINYFINNYKIAGIIQNDNIIYGNKYFIDKIKKYFFKVSYNSFFQINSSISEKLFLLIENNTLNSNKVLDLYCGVGTLSIVASENAKEVLGVEIIENAVLDANFNKCLNKKENVTFICDDTKNILNKITNDFDTIIMDPPRSGVDKKVLEKILNEKIFKIIYVSCNPTTLARDLKILEKEYNIIDIKLLDMFPNTEHVESFCVLTHK